MKEDEDLEFTFRSIRKKKRRGGPGCPICGETAVSNGKTYDCGYSSSAKGDTPCVNAGKQELVADDTFISNLKKSFHKKKEKETPMSDDEFLEYLSAPNKKE
jgi:hypothetical protein